MYFRRILGVNRTGTYPTNVLWAVTGNNLEIHFDMATRVLLLRLDADVALPYVKLEHPAGADRHCCCAAAEAPHRIGPGRRTVLQMQGWGARFCI